MNFHCIHTHRHIPSQTHRSVLFNLFFLLPLWPQNQFALSTFSPRGADSLHRSSPVPSPVNSHILLTFIDVISCASPPAWHDVSHLFSWVQKKKTAPLTSHKVTRVLLYLAFLFWICYVDHLLFSLRWIHTYKLRIHLSKNKETETRDRNSLMTLNLV